MDNNMDNDISVLMVRPVSNYLEQEIERSFKMFKLWHFEDKKQFINTHKDSIEAVVGSAAAGADAELIESLPKLEIVVTCSVGLDKIDLAKCKEKGIRVANTSDVLTDDVADLAIRLILAVLRRICESDRYVRSWKWKKGEFKMTTKFTGKSVGILGLGRIATAIAKRAEAFGCIISYNSRTEKPNLIYKYYPNLVDLASKCQVLVVVCSQQKKHNAS